MQGSGHAFPSARTFRQGLVLIRLGVGLCLWFIVAMVTINGGKASSSRRLDMAKSRVENGLTEELLLILSLKTSLGADSEWVSASTRPSPNLLPAAFPLWQVLWIFSACGVQPLLWWRLCCRCALTRGMWPLPFFSSSPGCFCRLSAASSSPRREFPVLLSQMQWLFTIAQG